MANDDWEYRIRALRMRPRFRMTVELTPDEVVEELRACVDAKNCPFVTRFHQHQVEITIPESDQHFWSPYLNLLIDPDDSGALIDGRFGPNVSVWTMFVAAYAILSLIGSVGLIMGFSQLSLGESPGGLWVAAICLVLIAAVYGLALVGQNLAKPQMNRIREFVETTFSDSRI